MLKWTLSEGLDGICLKRETALYGENTMGLSAACVH